MEEAMLHELTTSNNFSYSKDVEHDGKRRAHDLKPFNFDSIVAATNNFSFLVDYGLVLHGKLPEEQEIAGVKNEIRLIAKL
ncbi:hypothetical protein AAG906_018662 [Vitis piasezkii]